MPTYEEIMEQMAGMSEEEIRAATEESKKICAEYCGVCPSYKGTGETELLFCATGKSGKITKEKGCLCGSCPVQTQRMNLRWDYYCTKGSGGEQLAAEKGATIKY
ncbi:MAG: DUF2769 domain-containing protein [Candidatus Hydrothermarchaeaceae archaeon]